MTTLKLSYEGGSVKPTMAKVRPVARTATSGTAIMKIPKGAQILGFLLQGIASDAGTTATISLGTTTTATELVNGYDVKTAANGVGPSLLPAVSGSVYNGSVLTSEVVVYVKYAETGGASTVGNWTLTCLHTLGGKKQ